VKLYHTEYDCYYNSPVYSVSQSLFACLLWCGYAGSSFEVKIETDSIELLMLWRLRHLPLFCLCVFRGTLFDSKLMVNDRESDGVTVNTNVDSVTAIIWLQTDKQSGIINGIGNARVSDLAE